MVQCGDMVVYGIHGVCRITDVECRDVNHKMVEYYVLEPVGQEGAKYYIPVHNPAAVAKMRRVLSRDELISLLKSDEVKLDAWISNETRRKEKYRELISKADCAELIRMIRALYFHRQEQLASGKKFHICDENFMRDAQRIIRSEVSLVLEIPKENVDTYLQDVLEGKE